ncbi:hypothetical protein AAG906_034225 [Vitis piasezkii]
MITFQRKRRKKVQESQELCCKSGNPVAAHRLDCACVCPKKGEVESLETSHRTGSYSSLPLLDMAMETNNVGSSTVLTVEKPNGHHPMEP